MNLRGLQNKDIHRSVVSAINAGNQAVQASHVELEAHQISKQYMLIDVNCDEKISYHANRPEGGYATSFKARPIFPNSILSTEVGITAVMPGGATPSPNTNTTVNQSHGILDYPAASSLYYRVHDPLPNYLGKQLYRNNAHIVGILEKESSLTQTDTALVDELRTALNTGQNTYKLADNLDTLLFIDVPSSQARQEHAPRHKSLNIRIRRLAHQYHRLNVIGKSSLVLCDSAGVAVDAIRLSVPAIFVNETPLKYEKLQACVLRFLQHLNYQRLVDEQKFELHEIAQGQSHDEYVLSNQSTLRALINAHLTSANPHPENIKLKITDTTTYQQDDLILSSQQFLYAKPNKSVRLTSTLESSRRKFQKFKESPVRFVEDSQSRVLRTLFSRKTSQ